MNQAIVNSPSIDTQAAFSSDNFNGSVMNTYGRFPVAMEKGEGCRLWDTDGKAYLDFVAGIATCTLGHAPSRFNRSCYQPNQKVTPCLEFLLHPRTRRTSPMVS